MTFLLPDLNYKRNVRLCERYLMNNDIVFTKFSQKYYHHLPQPPVQSKHHARMLCVSVSYKSDDNLYE